MNRASKTCNLILALDVPERQNALLMLEQLQPDLKWVKIGLQLFCRYGPDFVREIAQMGFKIFLDLKLHDIPNTVAHAVESVAYLPVDLLSVHISGGSTMLEWALEVQQEKAPHLKLLGISVLTTMEAVDLVSIGIEDEVEQQVLRLARLANSVGLHGIVCSPKELALLRRELGEKPILLTPGIRHEAAKAYDQKRIMTPIQAASLGANFIVVGRPILEARDPLLVVRSILSNIQ